MILGNASNVVWNGATVNSVWCNSNKVWPTAEANYWTAVGSSNTFNGNSASGNSVNMQCTAFTGNPYGVLKTSTLYRHIYTPYSYQQVDSYTGSSLVPGTVFKNFYLRVEHVTIAFLSYALTTARGISPFSSFNDGASAAWYSAHTSIQGVTANQGYGIYDYNFDIAGNANNSTAVVILTASAHSASLSNDYVYGTTAAIAGTYGFSPYHSANKVNYSLIRWTASGET